jgi:type II restriction enzyme
VNLSCTAAVGARYHSNTQVARVVTEHWFAGEMYCPACPSDSLVQKPNNSPSVDFACPECTAPYQLKSRKTALTNRIADAGYRKMIEAIHSAQVPNLVLLQYSAAWSVVNLLLVPGFFLTESAIEKRRPLSPDAERAGWVGCNILLNNIPSDGRIAVVSNGIPAAPSRVRREYQRIKPLSTLRGDMRGWTLDVLNAIRKLGKRELLLSDLYSFEESFRGLHPDNKNIQPKIRQQLQVLRDLGFLAFEGGGRYRVLQ